jgi:hypothetical protein
LSCLLLGSEPLSGFGSIPNLDSLSCTQSYFFTVTNICLRPNLYRDTAPVPFSSFINRENYPATYQTCTAIAPERNKTYTWMAKSTPYLACHRDSFPARLPAGTRTGSRMAAPGNTTSLYCRAVRCKGKPDYITITAKDS